MRGRMREGSKKDERDERAELDGGMRDRARVNARGVTIASHDQERESDVSSSTTQPVPAYQNTPPRGCSSRPLSCHPGQLDRTPPCPVQHLPVRACLHRLHQHHHARSWSTLPQSTVHCRQFASSPVRPLIRASSSTLTQHTHTHPVESIGSVRFDPLRIHRRVSGLPSAPVIHMQNQPQLQQQQQQHQRMQLDWRQRLSTDERLGLITRLYVQYSPESSSTSTEIKSSKQTKIKVITVQLSTVVDLLCYSSSY